MKKKHIYLLFLFLSFYSYGNVRLPRLISDNMVLQREKPITIWGWAEAGEKVNVQFNKQTKSTKTDKSGKWIVTLEAEAAGGPFVMTVKGKNTITINDILVGEVWVCSGQSNMEWPVRSVTDAENEINNAKYPEIRHFTVQRSVSVSPEEEVKGGDWKKATYENVGNFTAVGYFFAREVYNTLKIPIGIVHTSWGGTNSETWTSKQAFEQSEEFKEMITAMPSIDPDEYSKKKIEEANKKLKDSNISLPAGTEITGTAALGPNSYPTLLFNGMINPILNYSIRGVLWYQGESNAGRAYQYRKAFPLMIQDWRNHFKQGDFPFYFVQLASFNASNGNSRLGSAWAELREAQTMTLSLPNTGMAVTTDIGEANDIHPRNKQDVGKRLAAIALNQLYQQKQVDGGPVFQSMNAEGDKIRITFTGTGSGLMVKDKYGYLKGFEIAGDDQKFSYAKAMIEGNEVVVFCEAVARPVAVRFAWADNPDDANLFNKEGFPAVPFRTDRWKGVTEAAKFKID